VNSPRRFTDAARLVSSVMRRIIRSSIPIQVIRIASSIAATNQDNRPAVRPIAQSTLCRVPKHLDDCYRTVARRCLAHRPELVPEFPRDPSAATRSWDFPESFVAGSPELLAGFGRSQDPLWRSSTVALR